MKIAFIGLGVMGNPMAGHLVKHDRDVVAFNRTASKALDWHKHYPSAAIATTLSHTSNTSEQKDAFLFDSLDSLIPNMDVIISCIGKDEDVAHLGEKIASHGTNGLLWIDHTTISADLAKNLHAKLKAKHMDFIDAPVSGGQAGAINAGLTAMCGGDKTAFDKSVPIMAAYAKSITHVGDSGSGQLTKMVNQICLAGVLQGLSEGLHFAKQAGLDPHKAIEAISKGAAQSWQMDNRASTMIEGEFDFGFAIDLMRKDLAICLHHASKTQTTLKITELIDGFYQRIQDNSGGKLDTSALIKQFD